MNWPEGWLVTRKSDGRPGVVRNAWMQSEGDPDQEHWRVFVEALDVPQTFLSPGLMGEPASYYDGNPVHAETCANCNKPIDSAYGDPGETPEPEISEPGSE